MKNLGKKSCAALIIAFTYFGTGIASGQSDGAVILRIPDGTKTRCINPEKDRIWLTMRRAVLKKEKNWMVEDTSVAFILNTAVKTDPVLAKPLTFPLAAEATLKGYANGQISVPIEYSIVENLPLRRNDNSNIRIVGLSLEMTLLNIRGTTPLGGSLQALIEVTKKLPIPTDPVSLAASYLLDFANNALSKDIGRQPDEEKARTASISMNFSPTGQCGTTNDFEATGTKVILQSKGFQGPNLIPIDSVNEYCWRAELTPAFVLKATKIKDGKDCSARLSTDFFPVSNNFISFFLNAEKKSGTLGPSSDEDRAQSKRRCEQNGINVNSCFGIR